MKQLFLSSLVIFAAMVSFAQSKDPKAKVILDAVSAKFKSYQSASANFSYSVLNSAGKVLSSKKGTVVLKNEKYNINFGVNKIISDGATVWNYDASAKEVTINVANKSESTITPQKLFSDFYNKDFNYTLDKDFTVGGKQAHKIILTPVDNKKPFEKVYLGVDKISKNILSILVVEKSGNRYSYDVSGFKPNVAVNDAMFIFNKSAYPDVEEVDLR
jgi:outer membrane lipoprotein-sorting protein